VGRLVVGRLAEAEAEAEAEGRSREKFSAGRERESVV